MPTSLLAPSSSLTRVGIDKIIKIDMDKQVRYASRYVNISPMSPRQRFEKRFGLQYQGLPVVKPENQTNAADVIKVVGERDYQPITYGLRFDVSGESQRADIYGVLAADVQKREIGKNFVRLENYEFCNVLNNQTSTTVGTRSYAGVDGVGLVSHLHPLADGAFFSNRGDGTSDIAFNQFNLETGIQRLMQQVNYNGDPDVYEGPYTLWVPAGMLLRAQRVVGSDKLQGTADNDVNASKAYINGVVTFGPYLTSTTAWGFIPSNKSESNIFGLEFMPVTSFVEDDGMAWTKRCNTIRTFGIYFDSWQKHYGTAGA